MMVDETFSNEFNSREINKTVSVNHTERNISNVATASIKGLDHKAQEILSFIHAYPPVYNFEPSIVRANHLNPFEHIESMDIVKEDIKIPCSNHKIKARIYRPNNGQEITLPALVYFHGGGFVLGSIESYDKMLSQLCSQSNVVIISVDYRLAPETVFPGAVEDTQQVMDWLSVNTKSLKIDINRVAIGGDSAGANLATVYCILNKERSDFKPYFQLLIYPSLLGNDSSASREMYSENLLLTKEVMHWFHTLYITKEQDKDPRFNVLNFNDFSNTPSAFILTCGFDPLRDEGQMYVDRLISEGIKVKHSCYTDMFHGFINFGHLKQAKTALKECAEILKEVMNKK